jgi:hypothetical protein
MCKLAVKDYPESEELKKIWNNIRPGAVHIVDRRRVK